MMYAVFAFAGCAIAFFGYDTAVMSRVNNNLDYQREMVLQGVVIEMLLPLGG